MPASDRLDLLLRTLRDRPGVTCAELARELGVSERTVFRHLDALRERGYPVEAARGRGGGVRLHPNWGLGRVLLATEEALCALLSLAVSEKLGFPMFAAELPRVRRKLVDAFPAGERRRLGPLRERVFVGAPASAEVRASYRSPPAAVMRPLQAAFVGALAVDVVYANERGERLARRVEPHALLINWPAWYVLGFDHLRGACRTFRCDRFESVAGDPRATFRPRPREVLAQVGGDHELETMVRTLE